jgi:hypothetical protein
VNVLHDARDGNARHRLVIAASKRPFRLADRRGPDGIACVLASGVRERVRADPTASRRSIQRPRSRLRARTLFPGDIITASSRPARPPAGRAYVLYSVRSTSPDLDLPSLMVTPLTFFPARRF